MEPISPELVLIDPELARAARRRAMAEPFLVAFVCTGNRFRSVIAEAAFRSAAEGLPVRVESYGTLNLGPVRPLPEALREAEALGLDVSAYTARPLTGADLAEASLVVGFEHQHGVDAIEVAGARSERVFALRELVALLGRVGNVPEDDPIERAVEIIARADEYRRNGTAASAGGEIEDPIGLADVVQRMIARIVYEMAVSLAQQLFGASVPPAPPLPGD